MKRIILHAAFVVVASTQLGATNCGQVTRDPGFDLWCGNELCVWKVVRGDVRRVATWHDGDSGVELLGSDTAISQLTPVNSIDGTCIRFDLVANVAETAEVDLNIDVEGDGTVDKQERVPTASWKPVSFRIFVKAPYDGIRFELAKHGTGTAILARINAELADDCEGLAPIAASQRPDGASCGAPEDCASGTCAQLTIFGAPPGSTDGLTCSRCSAGTCGAAWGRARLSRRALRARARLHRARGERAARRLPRRLRDASSPPGRRAAARALVRDLPPPVAPIPAGSLGR